MTTCTRRISPRKSLLDLSVFRAFRIALLILIVLALVGCGGTTEEPPAEEAATIPPPTLEALAEVELTGLSGVVLDQILETRRSLDEALEGDVEGRELGQRFGRMGRLYHAYEFENAALICYRNAEALISQDPRWPYLLGVLLQAQGDATAATAAFRRVLDLAGEDLPSLLRLAELEIQAGRHSAARVPDRARRGHRRSGRKPDGRRRWSPSDRDCGQAG